jgi:hypothetical protein
MLMGDNTTTSQGGQEQDVTKGRGGGEGKLVDVMRRCHKRQRGNQLGQTRGEWEVEFPAQRKVVVPQEAAMLTRGWEAEAAQQDATQRGVEDGHVRQQCNKR